jgi:hypothetical protein
LRDQLEEDGTVDDPVTVQFLPGTSLEPNIFLKKLAEKLQVELL